MADNFPFQLSPAPPPISPEYEMLVFADVGGLEEYYALFLHYGYGGTPACWAEHLETIVEEHAPALLDELEFTENGPTFVAYASNAAIAEQFLACVLPYFGTLALLRKYLSQADPDDFFA
ncbi:MAG: immunity 51 family protein [Bacteroidota bacterium]|nr:immunity 51 family protein [Bacteroidota bacterium]